MRQSALDHECVAEAMATGGAVVRSTTALMERLMKQSLPGLWWWVQVATQDGRMGLEELEVIKNSDCL